MYENSDHSIQSIELTRAEFIALKEDLARMRDSAARNSKAPATRRGYASDWHTFQAWCERSGLSWLPAAPETVALYIADLAESHKTATVFRHMAAIAARKA
jgi:hypothetical protein